MSSSELKFKITLEDGISVASAKASGSLKDVISGLTKADDAIQTLGRQQSQALAISAAFDAKTSAMAKKKALADDAAVQRMGRIQVAAHKMNAEFDSKKGESSFKMLGEALTSTGEIFKKVAEGALLVGGAIAGLTFEVLKFASEASEAKERAVVLFDALGDGSEGAGEKTFALIDGLSTKLPQSRAQLTGWTKELESLGITDLTQIRSQLVTLSSAQALAGEEGSAAYLKLQRRIQTLVEVGQNLKLPVKGLGSLAEMGLRVDDVAKQMGVSAHVLGAQLKAGTADAGKFGAALELALASKGKGALTTLNSSIGTVFAKGKEAFGKLFDSIDFKPLADAAQEFFSILNTGESTGAALKGGIGGALNSIVVSLGKGLEQAEIFFLKIELWSLQNRAALKGMWEAGLTVGALFFSFLKEVGVELGRIASIVVKVGEGIGFIGSKLGIIDTSVAKADTPEEYSKKHGGAALPAAPAHASGGLVQQPAAGEAFASVAPGEFILPKEQARAYMATGVGAGQPAQDSPSVGAGGITIQRLDLTVQAAAGISNAMDLSVTGLTLALERIQLASGR